MVSAQELGFKRGEAKVYEGMDGKPFSYLDAASQVKAAGQHAAGTLFVLEQRYAELRRFADIRRGEWGRADFQRECPWSTHYFDTSTAVLPSSNMIVIQHDSPNLGALIPQTPFDDNGLKFTDSLGRGNFQVYSGNVLKKLNRPLNEEEVVKGDYVNPLWLGFAEGREELIRNITPLIFKALRDCYDFNQGMGTYFNLNGTLRSVFLDGLGDDGAGAYGEWGHLGYVSVRLVGLHSQEKEACAASAPLEERVDKGTTKKQ